VLRAVKPDVWDNLMQGVEPLLPQKWHLASAGDKAHKLSEVLTLSSGHAYLLRLASCWQDPTRVVADAHEPATVLTDPAAWPRTNDLAQWMMAMDAQSYLPDDILVKVDRSAMANSLETRVPMLDHRVVEFALRMPLHMKIRDGQGKWILRQVLHRYVPRELIERPKMGFALPMDQWLRGPLRDWAEALLGERRLREEGYFDPMPIRKKWKEHLSGRRNWQRQLWTVLMFQGWLEENRGAS
jgi:asparagine synthase (glutamine-hydrolysing)